MAVTYTKQHKPLSAQHTGARSPYAVHVVQDLADSANVQKLHTSAQVLSQWWSAADGGIRGLFTTAGTVGEQYMAQWPPFPVARPTTRLIVELGGHQIVAGTTVWRLYSLPTLYTGDTGDLASASVVSVSINSTTHAFTAPVFLTIAPFHRAVDNTRCTYLVLTAENLDQTTQGRLWTLHARPAPDVP